MVTFHLKKINSFVIHNASKCNHLKNTSAFTNIIQILLFNIYIFLQYLSILIPEKVHLNGEIFDGHFMDRVFIGETMLRLLKNTKITKFAQT